MATKAKTIAPPDLKQIRRQLMAKFGSRKHPEVHVPEPAALEAALAMCASAGLPEGIVTTETISPPEGGMDYTVDVYTFCHYRLPGLQFKVTADDLALWPERVVQACKNAGIRADSLEITDDLPEIPDPPPEV